jgi:peptidyl-tRNA hydrolase, PTH1 family
MFQLIAGLGNPGSEYERTRHNAGFWFLDALARQAGASMRAERGFYGDIARTCIEGETVWLAKPTTFMNRSGQCVAALAKFYKIAPEKILIVHDELDLQPGEVKLKIGGSAGSNGVKSIEADLGSREFWRLRIGIGHPGVKSEVVNYVLHKASSEHQAAMDEAIKKSLDVMPLLMRGESERAMMQLHRKPKPPKPPAELKDAKDNKEPTLETSKTKSL